MPLAGLHVDSLRMASLSSGKMYPLNQMNPHSYL